MRNIEQSNAGSEARGNGHGEILVELDLTRRSAGVVSRSVVAFEKNRAQRLSGVNERASSATNSLACDEPNGDRNVFRGRDGVLQQRTNSEHMKIVKMVYR